MEDLIFFGTCIFLLLIIGIAVLALIKSKDKKDREFLETYDTDGNFAIGKLVEHITSQSDKAQATFLYKLVGSISQSHCHTILKYSNGRLQKKQSELRPNRGTSTGSTKDATIPSLKHRSKSEASSKKA